jgi:flagellar protein FlaG
MIDGLGSATTADPGRTDRQPPATPQALDTAISQFNRSVNFRIDQNTGHQVITIRDRATGETIRQIPSKTFLALAERMDEMRGILFEKVA